MQWVIPLLLEQGHTIKGVDNFARYGLLARQRNYEFICGDLTDPDFTESVASGVDAILQAAALIYGVGGFHRRPADILSKDVALNHNIMQTMLKKDIGYIAYISSSMVYERCTSHPSTEDSVFNSLVPATDYGLSKLVNERMIHAFAQQYGISYSIWRPFNIITPYEKGESVLGDSHVFADYIRNIIVERMNPLPIIGDGYQIRCFTWIDDVARGIAVHGFGGAKHALNETFNLGNPEPHTMRELAFIIYQQAQNLSLLAKTDQQLAFKTVDSFADDVVKRIPDISKAQKVLDWHPTYRLADSVAECLKVM